jgi:hypothetical protein
LARRYARRNATVEAIRKEGGKNFVDLVVTTVNQNGVEVKGQRYRRASTDGRDEPQR